MDIQRPASSPSFDDLAAQKSALDSIITPPVQCSFPCHIHPEYVLLKEISDAWIFSRFGDLRSISSFTGEDLVKGKFDLLVTVAYSNGISKRMIPVLKFIVWFFAYDNFLDHPNAAGADSAAAEQMLSGVFAVLEAKEVAPSARCAVTALMIEVLREWWDEICEDMPVTQQLRFIRQLKVYQDASWKQVSYRRAERLPNLETYDLIRRDAGGWLNCCVLIEYVLGLELDEETLAHPLVRKLHDTAAFHVHWANDLISFKKEFREGDYLNAVAVLYFNSKTTPRPSLQQVVSEVSQSIKDTDDECVRLVNEIKKTDLLMEKPGMERFLEGVRSWLAGSVYWHLVSARY